MVIFIFVWDILSVSNWKVLQLLQLRDDFQESVEMSTYLVAFVVCDYKRITRETQKKVSVSVYAPNEMISQASFALLTAADAMDYYEEFFGVPYPLPKQGKLNLFLSVRHMTFMETEHK